MRCTLSMGNTRMKFIAGAVLFSLASYANAATSLVGGGATLPTYGYLFQSAGAATAGNPLVATSGNGSLFAVYTAATTNTITYCPTGSGAGKRILANNNPSVETPNAACLSGTNPTGFQKTGAAAISQADFAGSDAPLSSSEFDAYKTGHGGALPEQFPAVAGAIAIAFNKTGVTSLTLSEGQICGIFSGQIKTWNDPALSGTVPSGTTGNITVFYRQDGSGTSFSLLNHLTDVCRTQVATGKSLTAQNAFKTDQAFGTVGAASYVGLYSAGSAAKTGNQGVTDAVKATDGSIGYAEAAYPINAPTRFASVKNTAGNTVNPQTGFGPTAIPVALTFGQAITGVDSAGRPVLGALSTSTQCVAIVDPKTYSNLGAASGSTTYPILAITNLLGNQSSNGTKAAAIRTLLGSVYTNAANRSSVTRIGRVNTGYAWLKDATGSSVLDSTNATTGIQARINACIN